MGIAAEIYLTAVSDDEIGEAHKQGIIYFWSAAQAFVDEIHHVAIRVKYLVHREILVYY